MSEAILTVVVAVVGHACVAVVSVCSVILPAHSCDSAAEG